MKSPPLHEIPGFRRRFIITPAPNCVRSELEDDYHCMGLTVHHDGTRATKIAAVIVRAPWTTCPGAEAVVQKTFTGVALEAFVERGEKRANCTHLHDMAILAAAHAFDDEPLVYDILVSDPPHDPPEDPRTPDSSERRAELRRNGTTVLSWRLLDGRMAEPPELAGLGLYELREWIDSLDPIRQEYARLLRWGTLIANGRTIPWERQIDATTRMLSASCYTFQPNRVDRARRIGVIRDFSTGPQPLEEHRPSSMNRRSP